MGRRPAQRTESEVATSNSGNRKRKQQSSEGARKAATKSRYFKSKTEIDENEAPSEQDESSAAEDESVQDHESSGSDDDDLSSEEEKPRRKRRAPNAAKTVESAPAVGTKGKELWRQGVNTGLEPGTQVVIKKPKPRAAGSTPYADNTIHPNTMLFLGDLKANNDREWFKMHDPDYRTSLKDWNSFVEALTEKLIQVDDTIPELPVKDIVFRIYRDIRFSKDPTPYKPYFSAAWSRTGRKGPYAAYYVQISSNDSFVGGGMWHPEAQAIASLRSSIDQNPQQLKSVLMDDRLRREFLGNVPKKAEKVVRKFISLPSNSESALKTKPKGYDVGHPEIDLLRLRNFTVGTKLNDAEVLGAQVLQRVTELFSAMQPFIACLNRIVLPDPGEEDEEDDIESETEATDA